MYEDFIIEGTVLKEYIGNDSIIVIPEGVTEIGKWAFSDKDTITEIKLPSTLTGIEYGAFMRCKKLKNINLPEGLKSIAMDAFYSCSALTSIYIPASVESIGSGVFTSATCLHEINVSAENHSYVSENGVLFSKDKSVLVAYPFAYRKKSYYVNAAVKKIGDRAFQFNKEIEYKVPGELNLNDDPNVALEELLNRSNSIEDPTPETLEHILIGQNVTEIGDYAFAGREVLEDIVIPQNVEKIGKNAFKGCKNLVLRVPVKFKSMDAEFKDCKEVIFDEDDTTDSVIANTTGETSLF